MAGARQNLFKWNRKTDPKTNYSKGDVQDWIKRVERASSDAAREVFGSNYQSVLEQVHVDDDALLEAQDLLDSWMHEKKLDDFNLEVQFKDEKWAQKSTPTGWSSQTPQRNGSDRGVLSADKYGRHVTDFTEEELLQSQDWTGSSAQKNIYPNVMGSEYDDELNDEISVQQILRGMLDKKVVEKDILDDLGFDSSKRRRDPRPKMELRHQQVKEKSVARQKEVESRRRERTAHKQAEAEARQQLIREEKERQACVKREEDEIQKEMMRIRRVMEQEKKVSKEKFESDVRKNQEAEMLALQYLEEEERVREEQQRNDIEEKEGMRRMLLEQMERNAAQEASKNLRVLQKYFSAWYSVVAAQRIQLGKAGALCDWRCKLRAWNAWQAYINHIRSDKEAQAVTQHMKEKHRKEQLSFKFYRRHVLFRCLRAWQQWVRREQDERQLQEEHNNKTQKMAALLEAAATGKLWSKQGGLTTSLELEDIEDETGPSSRTSTARKVDELFSQPVRQIPSKHSMARGSSVDEDSARKMANENKPVTCKPAWDRQERKEQPKKHAASESSLVKRKKSQRQQNLTEVEHIENFHATKDKVRREVKKEDCTLRRINSEDRLDSQEKPNNENTVTRLLTDRSDSSALTNASRESAVKSKKPATKPLHLAMEERAMERMNRKAALEDKKRKGEEEKLAFLKMEQERKEAELLAEKQETLRKRKEEKRLARERELEKQHQLEHNRQQIILADQHYAFTLLTKYGLLPWKRLVAMAQEHMSRAVSHCNLVSLRSCFYPWLAFTIRVREDREKMAETLYRKILLHRTWRQWRKYGQHALRLQMVADDYCSSYLVRKYFKYWQDYVTEEQIMLWEKERRADQHNEWRLKKLAMIYWKKYIPLTRSDREKEVRKAELRKRVHSWLPDFQTGDNTSP